MELLPLSYRDSRRGSLCSWRLCVLTGITTTPSKIAVDLPEQQLAMSTISQSHWPLHCLLKNYTNTTRLNALICDQVLSENDFLRNSAQNHKLVVAVDKSEPTQMSEKKLPMWNARRGRHLPYSTSHPCCKRRSRIKSLGGFWWHWRICFVTVGFFYWSEKIQPIIRLLCNHQLAMSTMSHWHGGHS